MLLPLFQGFLALGLVSAATLAMAQNLSELTANARADIERICLPVQYSDGAAAYRDCVNNQVTLRSDQTVAVASDLSFDERYAIQQACRQSGNPGTAANNACVAEQEESLNGIPAPRLALLSDDENYALQQTCFEAQTTLGVRAYRQCLNDAVAKLKAVPEPDLSSLTLVEKNALQIRCSALHDDAADYRSCLLAAVDGNNAGKVNTSTIIAAVAQGQESSSTDDEQNTNPDGNDAARSSDQAPDNSTEQAVTDDASAGGANVGTTESVADSTPATPMSAENGSGDTVPGQSSEEKQQPARDTSSPQAPLAASDVQTTQGAASGNSANDGIVAEANPASEPAGNATTSTVAVANTGESVDPAIDSTDPSTQNGSIQTPVAEVGNVTADTNNEQVDPVAQTQDTQRDGSDTSSLSADATTLALNEATSSASTSNEPVSSGNPDASTAPALTSGSTVGAANSGVTEADPTAITASPIEQTKTLASTLWARLQATLDNITGMNRLILFGAMALPMLLAGFWLMMRGRETEPEYVPPAHPHPLVDRVGPSQQKRVRATSDADLDALSESLDFSSQADDMFGPSTGAQAERSAESDTPADARLAETRRVDDQEISALATARGGQSDDTPSPFKDLDREFAAAVDAPAISASTSPERSGFLHWLSNHSEQEQLQLIVEFLIYWTAYADERYEPDLKARIFALKDPDDHDLIKRWVLKQDTKAFSETIRWLQSNASPEQREQVLDLLMALLITENALTPVQNTLLRFLGDAFGLGSDKLDEKFSRAFGHSMPPLPRVDKPNWWKRQTRENLARWDARWVSAQEPDLQHRVKLGLPFNGPLSDELIQSHYQRAVARCHPDRFHALSNREQLLAERQLTKFTAARDGLLEVSA